MHEKYNVDLESYNCGSSDNKQQSPVRLILLNGSQKTAATTTSNQFARAMAAMLLAVCLVMNAASFHYILTHYSGVKDLTFYLIILGLIYPIVVKTLGLVQISFECLSPGTVALLHVACWPSLLVEAGGAAFIAWCLFVDNCQCTMSTCLPSDAYLWLQVLSSLTVMWATQSYTYQHQHQ